MPALLEMHLSDDSVSTFTDLGVVPAGQLSSGVTVRLVNVGDAATTNVRAWVEGSTSVRYILGGTLVTGTDAATATVLTATLGPNDGLDGVIDGTGPSSPLETTALRVLGD